MALYKYSAYLQPSDHQAFDLLNSPGTLTPYSGVYRCYGCGLEIAEVRGRPLPPQNHHQHVNQAVPIQWQLIVTHK
jgi:hypothetical protein